MIRHPIFCVLQTDSPKFAILLRRCSSKSNLFKERDDEIIYKTPLKPNTFVETVGSILSKWNSVLQKHPELKSLTQENLKVSADTLKAYNYKPEDILQKPTILFLGPNTIENRIDVLNECGVQPIPISTLFRYVTVMNKSVVMLKAHQHISYETNVVERLVDNISDIKLKLKSKERNECNENVQLKGIREIILNAYLKQRLNMSAADIEKLWKSYGRVRHKSFKSVQSVIQLLQNELNFPQERIVKNSFLLYGDSSNIRRILMEIPTIGGHSIKDIGYRRPKILMSNCDMLIKTLKYVREFGIDEYAVTRCLEVLTLGPETILERLRDLQSIDEFKVLSTNPRILRLVHYQNKARARLEYLNQLKVRCASLHILSCGSEDFVRFARDGCDRTKGRDVVIYLAHELGKNENDIRRLMSRHPNWCHIPLLHIKSCYEFLLGKKFSNEQIYQNIHLLLYPISRIEEKLVELHRPDGIDTVDLPYKTINELSNSEILTLIFYLIESEFHFTGDGVWTEQHTAQVENFNNILPDFPEAVNKVYKYGVKPAAERKGTIEKDCLLTC